MLKPLIRTQFLFTLLTFVVVLASAHYIARTLIRMDHVDILKHQADLFMLTLNESKGEKVETARKINALNEANGGVFRIDLIQNGKSMLTGEPYTAPPESRPRAKPIEKAYGFPDDPQTELVIRLGPPPGARGGPIMTAVLFLAVVLASFLSVLVFFWRFRNKAEVAKSVLSRMQQGDLKARFPLSKWDDAGQVLKLFNEMADEIERLVERLRANEKTRMQLMGDIAHDLRTPIASLRAAIENLHDRADNLTPSERKEFTEMAFSETEYLERLVEDLLFLALVVEPKYKSAANAISVQELVRGQIPAVQAKYPEIETSEILSIPVHLSQITGNAHLLTRLVRNALENSYSFAKNKVEIRVNVTPDLVEVTVADDGPGFSTEALENFGKKRATRYISDNQSARLSVGLGSVIMKAIVNAHGGTIKAENRLSEKGDVAGGRVTIALRF